MDRTAYFEQRARELKQRFDADDQRKALWPRPFMVELFGTPKAGKTTVAGMIKHFFKRQGWAVSQPVEGAEVVEWKRVEPAYNFQTAEYALGAARDRLFNKNFHVVIFDRAIFDGIVRMDYYVAKGVMTEGERQVIEGYYTLPWNRKMFDLHICLTASPEVAIERELARSLTKKDGETMNQRVLSDLLAAHERVLARLKPSGRFNLLAHDSTGETEEQTAGLILNATLDAFEGRLAALT